MSLTELEALSHKHPIIFYDGVCILCNKFIQFVNKFDKGDSFRFIALQDESGQIVRDRLDLHSVGKYETVILMHKAKTFELSDVSFEVFKILGWPFKGLLIFSILPNKILNMVYSIIARNRYKLFGKSEACIIPTGSLKDKFLK